MGMFKSIVKKVRKVGRKIRRVVKDPTGQKRAIKKAETLAKESKAKFDRESAAFAASQQQARDRLSMRASDEKRGGRRSSSRRSLLTGDERGVDEAGKRKITG